MSDPERFGPLLAALVALFSAVGWMLAHLTGWAG